MKIIISNLNKKYAKKGKYVLKNINLELENGIYGLIGPNGSGKTTLIHLILGLITMNSGSIKCGDRIKYKSNKYYKLVGYLPQYPVFYKNFTALEFMRYVAVLKGIENNIDNIINELLKLVNLTQSRNTKIGDFSGGMRQRLGIAQALINNPKILILDEPTAGLDPKERIRFRNIISQLSNDRIIIFSTHIISDVEYIADRIILLKDGKIIKNETPDVLLDNLKDKVREVVVDEFSLSSWLEDFDVSNIRRKEDGIVLRLISDNQIGKKCVPRLEDLYLLYFGEHND